MKKLYSKFNFVGKIGFNDALPQAKESTGDYYGNVQKTIDYGYAKKVITYKDGQPNRTELQLNMYVEADGAREYLKLKSFVSVDKKPTVLYRGNGESVTARIDEANASDPKIVENCMDFLKRKISIDGDEMFETLSDGHYIQKIIENMNEINGKRFIVSGSVGYYSGQKGVGMNFTPSYIRPVYENSEDKLEIRTETHFIKNSGIFMPYSDFEKLPIKKVPFNIFVPVQEKSPSGEYLNKIVKTKDLFYLNMEIVNSPQLYNMIETVTNSTPTGGELESMKYYTTEFVCRIKGEQVGGDLSVDSLTMQEKLLHQADPVKYSIDEIKKIRGIRPKTSKNYLIEPMFIGGVNEDEVAPSDIFGSKVDAPKTISLEDAQNIAGIPQTPTPTVMPPKAPPVGIDMSQFLK